MRIEDIRDEISDRMEYVGAWMTARTDRRTRWVGTTVVVLCLHVTFFWVLILSKTQEMNLATYEEPVQVEFYEVARPPEPEPRPQIEPVPQPKTEAEDQTTPQVATLPEEEVIPPEVEPIPETVSPPQPRPVETPRASLTVKPLELPELNAKQTTTARTQVQRDVELATVPGPTVAVRPSPNLGVRKKKKEDEEALSARATETARAGAPSRDIGDMNLHQPPHVSADVPTSGLTASGGKPGGGTTAGGLLPGGLNGLGGAGLQGRSGISQAIRNHNSCVELQRLGKPIPESCKMDAMASAGRMGPKPDANFQAEAARRDAYQTYKAQPGSTEYWQRVNRPPTPGSAGRDDDLPRKGEYADPKDARVMNGDNIDPINGN